MDPPLFTSYSLPHPVPSVPSIVPEMLEQEFEDTPEGSNLLFLSITRKLKCHVFAEREAARVRSEQIDAELASEAISRARRRQEEVHVLLLGINLSRCRRSCLEAPWSEAEVNTYLGRAVRRGQVHASQTSGQPLIHTIVISSDKRLHFLVSASMQA